MTKRDVRMVRHMESNNVTCHINRKKNKNFVIISTDSEEKRGHNLAPFHDKNAPQTRNRST